MMLGFPLVSQLKKENDQIQTAKQGRSSSIQLFPYKYHLYYWLSLINLICSDSTKSTLQAKDDQVWSHGGPILPDRLLA